MAGMQYIDIGADTSNVVAVAATGEISADAMADFIQKIETHSTDGEKLRLFVDMTGYTGFEWGVVPEKLAHLRTLLTSFDRIAYVVDRGWMATGIGLVDALTPMSLRAFSAEDRDEAVAWVLES